MSNLANNHTGIIIEVIQLFIRIIHQYSQKKIIKKIEKLCLLFQV